MKTIRLSFLLLSTVSLVRAERFDLEGSTVVGAITFNGANVTSLTASSAQVITNDYPTSIDSGFKIPNFSATFDIYDDSSSYLGPILDLQGSLNLVNLSMSTSFTIQAGSSFVIDFDFASASAQAITGFEFVARSYRPELAGVFSVQFNPTTSTLTLTAVNDFTVLDMENIVIDGRFLSAIPEPATSAVLIGLGVLSCAALSRRRSQSSAGLPLQA